MKTADEIVADGYDRVDARLVVLRLSPSEFLDQNPVMTYWTYWRALTGRTRPFTRMKVLRTMEQALDAFEAKQKEQGA